MKTTLLNILAVGALAVSANAVPTLQLDVVGGVYYNPSETTLASSNPFSLVALLSPDEDKGFGVANTYYVSAAIMADAGKLGKEFGSFKFAGTTVDSSQVVLGTPAALGPHGVFDTYYKEFSFTFDSANEVKTYNAVGATESHQDPALLTGIGSYYSKFLVDISGLKPGYAVHFDLYAYGEKKPEFAPYSHDAGSGKNPPVDPPGTVPDGGATLALLGLGFIAVEGLRRKLS
jgi:hypothetical protein